MIPGTGHSRQISRWQREQACAISDPAELLRELNLDPALLPGAQAAAALFPLRVPRGYVARMQKGDPNDPLLRQVLPLGVEIESVPGFVADPVGDLKAMVVPGILQKYHGRALLITTGACGVHCRYCFRREFPYAEAAVASGDWRRALDYLSGDARISEVILSGGDPLLLSNRRLAALLQDLTAMAHVKRLRIHSRQPIVLPERVDGELVELLSASRLKVVLVLHANHPREIDETVKNALTQLANAGIVLLNQSVLLKGVNDSADILAELSETMFNAGVIPYYLHLLDPVIGTAHFLVEESCAIVMMKELRNRLPGYLVPRLVREETGKPAKSLII
jgi:EF-P beta-lysylation protein EpmB